MRATSSSVLLDTLAKAGITHAFVNLGSDHPALLEAWVARQNETPRYGITFVTSPNESVALNCAQGYYQACGCPAAVIVHVDCGTQALAGAIHNVAVSRIPVFIFAGASPFTQEGELVGSRNEFIHWLQNATDQPAIVRQYMKHVAEIRTARNAQQVILRALQIATSEPKGPVYCWAAREVMEEEIEDNLVQDLDLRHWQPTEPVGLTASTLRQIVDALTQSTFPVIVTSHVGRNPASVPLLSSISDKLGIPVFSACPSTLNVPFDHPMHAGVAYSGKFDLIERADCLLVIDSDVPWIPLLTKPRPDARIIHLDCDVLKTNMNLFYIPATIRAQVDSATALQQISEAIEGSFDVKAIAARRERIMPDVHPPLIKEKDSELPMVTTIMRSLRSHTPDKHLILNESISNYPLVWQEFKPTVPGSLITSGASSLGWGIGAAIGASLAGQAHTQAAKELITLVVGDGSFIFGVPSAAYWMARRYQTPFLTIVLNNGGWKSPRLSMLGVHPNGLGSRSSAGTLSVSFGPDPPDYGGIAAAAGGAWSMVVKEGKLVDEAIKQAIQVVTVQKRCAVLDFWLERF